MRLGRSISAIAGTSAIAVVGLFLGMSPWFAGWQHSGSWTLATKTDFWSGLGLVVIALAAMMMYRSSLNRDLATAGVIGRRVKLEGSKEASETNPAEATAPDLSDAALLALAASVVRDIRPSDGSGNALAKPGEAPIGDEELVRVASSLLQEIQGAPLSDAKDDASSEEPSSPLALMSEAELAKMAANLLQEIQAAENRPLVHSGEGARHE